MTSEPDTVERPTEPVARDVDTLGTLHDLLTVTPPDTPVRIDGASPSALSSYRGYYDHLAIECEPVGPNHVEGIDADESGTVLQIVIGQPVTASTLRRALELAAGRTFTGYKGGAYWMHARTPIWIAEYGTVSGRQISAYALSPNGLDLTTSRID